MFGDKKNKIKDSERSLISETVSIEGTINSSGAIDIAGLIKGPVISKEIIVRETGSITGSIEGDHIEVHGHMDGKISGGDIVIGSTGTVKGDIEFGNNLNQINIGPLTGVSLTSDELVEGFVNRAASVPQTDFQITVQWTDGLINQLDPVNLTPHSHATVALDHDATAIELEMALSALPINEVIEHQRVAIQVPPAAEGLPAHHIKWFTDAAGVPRSAFYWETAPQK